MLAVCWAVDSLINSCAGEIIKDSGKTIHSQVAFLVLALDPLWTWGHYHSFKSLAYATIVKMHGMKDLEKQNSYAFLIQEIVRSLFFFSSESGILLVLTSLLTFTFPISQEETFFICKLRMYIYVRPQIREQWSIDTKRGMCNCLVCTNTAISDWNGFTHLCDQVHELCWTYIRSIHTLHEIFTHNILRDTLSTWNLWSRKWQTYFYFINSIYETY